jgi:hypothetical protein
VWLPRRWSAIVVLSNEETTDTKAVARHLMAHGASATGLTVAGKVD